MIYLAQISRQSRPPARNWRTVCTGASSTSGGWLHRSCPLVRCRSPPLSAADVAAAGWLPAVAAAAPWGTLCPRHRSAATRTQRPLGSMCYIPEEDACIRSTVLVTGVFKAARRHAGCVVFAIEKNTGIELRLEITEFKSYDTCFGTDAFAAFSRRALR